MLPPIMKRSAPPEIVAQRRGTTLPFCLYTDFISKRSMPRPLCPLALQDLCEELTERAEAIALNAYGCDLDRLDPESLNWYLDRVTPENLEDLASDLAAAAWFDT